MPGPSEIVPAPRIGSLLGGDVSASPIKGGSLKETLLLRRKMEKKRQKEEEGRRQKEAAENRLVLDHGNGSRPGSAKEEGGQAVDAIELGKGEGAEAIASDMRVLEGSYDQVVQAYGLTMEHVMRFECLGVEKDVIATLCSLFTSLDKDGGGELSAVELYEALVAFGQNVNDDDVVAMMDEVDADNSGAVDFQEFLLLALPGFSKSRPTKPRKFMVSPVRSAMFEDADGCGGSGPDVTLELPEQCLREEGEEEDRDQLSEVKSRRKAFAELRLRFKFNNFDVLGRSESARGGNIILPLKLSKDNWIEQRYPFSEKAMATGSGGAGILFTAPPLPDPNQFPMPLSKLKCLKFPDGPILEQVGGKVQKVEGFRIVSVTPKKLQITFDYKYGEHATFPPPPYDFTIVQAGPGTSVSDIKAVVSTRCYMPRWTPFVLSSQVPHLIHGQMTEVEIRNDIGELYSLIPGENLVMMVSVSGPETRVPALLEHQAREHPWTIDMRSIDTSPECMVMCEFRLGGMSVQVLEKVQKEFAHVPLAAVFTEQVVSPSSRLTHGWMCCPPHPHILPLIMFAGQNITIHSSIRGVSGTKFAKVVASSKLTEHQKRILILTVGTQTAGALDHMHSHDIWHLDVKPDNLVIEVQGVLTDDRDQRRLRERINVRLADFSHCSCVSGTNLTLRGTPGFWSPEQIHTPGSRMGGDDGDGLKGEYWGGQMCRDPPMPMDADMSERSDSWGWATMMLSMMGRLNEMKSLGYTAFLQVLLAEGFTAKLNGMFSYEHEPYLESLQENAEHKAENVNKLKREADELKETATAHWQKIDSVWVSAEDAINDLTADDLKQISFYKRCPNLFRNVIDATVALALPDKKDGVEWNTLKEAVSTLDFRDVLLTYDRFKGLSNQSFKVVGKNINMPTFLPDHWNEDTVPQADPSKPGNPWKACLAFGLWVIAIAKYDEVSKIVAPILGEVKTKEKMMAKFTPGLDAALGKMKDYQAVVNKLKKNLEEKTSEVITIMLTKERTDAMSLVGTALEMEGALTDQQYFRLMRDVDHFLGEQSLVFRHLANSMPPLEIQPEVRAMLKTCARKTFYSRKDSRLEKGFEGESVLAKFPFLRGRSDQLIVPQEALNPLLGAASGLSALNPFPDLMIEGSSVPSVVPQATALPPLASIPPSANAHSRSGSLIGSETGSRELTGFGSTLSGLTPEKIPNLAGLSTQGVTSRSRLISDGKSMLLPESTQLWTSGSERSLPQDKSILADVILRDRDDVKQEATPGKVMRSLANAPSMRQLVSTLPPQAIRGGMIGKHINDIRGVGDGLLLAIAWCLQYQPGSRVLMSTLCTLLNQIMPGQEWLSASTVPGRRGYRNQTADQDVMARDGVDMAPSVAKALLGQHGKLEYILLIERRGVAREDEGWFLAARDMYMQAFHEAKQLAEHSKKEDGMWCVVARIALSLSRTWMKLDKLYLAMEWRNSCETFLEQAEEGADDIRENGSQVETGINLVGRKAGKDGRSSRVGIAPELRARERILQVKKLRAVLFLHSGELQLAIWIGGDAKSLLKNASQNFSKSIWHTEKIKSCDDVAKAMLGVARVLELQGSIRAAREEYQRALETRASIYGYDGYCGTEGLAPILEALARTNERLGFPTTAFEQLERAKHIYLSLSARDMAAHPGVARVLCSIGKLRLSVGNISEAFRAFEEGHRHISESINETSETPPRRPMNHPGLTMQLGDAFKQKGELSLCLGNFLAGAIDFQCAISCYQQSLSGPNFEKDAIEDHSAIRVADASIGLGQCLEEAGHHWQAADSFQKAYQLKFHVFGQEYHPQLAECSEKLAGIFWRLSRHGVSYDWYNQALRVREYTQGTSHPDLVHSLMNMASILRTRGQFDFASELSHRAMFIAAEAWGEVNTTVAYCLADIAVSKYPQLALDHAALARKRRKLIERQLEAEGRIGGFQKILQARKAEFQDIKKQTTIKQVIVKMKEEKMLKAKEQVKMSILYVKMCVNDCASALAEFEGVERFMSECVDLLEEAQRVHRLAVPHGAGHWEKQAKRVVRNMRADMARAKQLVEQQFSEVVSTVGTSVSGSQKDAGSLRGSLKAKSVSESVRDAAESIQDAFSVKASSLMDDEEVKAMDQELEELESRLGTPRHEEREYHVGEYLVTEGTLAISERLSTLVEGDYELFGSPATTAASRRGLMSRAGLSSAGGTMSPPRVFSPLTKTGDEGLMSPSSRALFGSRASPKLSSGMGHSFDTATTELPPLQRRPSSSRQRATSPVPGQRSGPETMQILPSPVHPPAVPSRHASPMVQQGSQSPLFSRTISQSGRMLKSALKRSPSDSSLSASMNLKHNASQGNLRSALKKTSSYTDLQRILPPSLSQSSLQSAPFGTSPTHMLRR